MRTLLLILILTVIPVFLSAETTPILRINPEGHRGQIRDMVFDKEGRIITAGLDKTVKIWNSEYGYLEREIFGQIGPGLEGAIYCLAISPDNKYLAVGGWFGDHSGTKTCGDLRLYDYHSGKLIKLKKMHIGALSEMRFFPSSKHLLSVDVHSVAYLWDIAGDKFYNFPNFEPEITDIEVYGEYILTTHQSGAVYLYNVDEKKPIASFKKIKAKNQPASCAAFTKTGDKIAVSTGGEFYVLDTQLKERYHVIFDKDPILEMNFSPDGTKLVVTTCSDIREKQQIGLFHITAQGITHLTTLEDYENMVLCADFLDNTTLVTGGSENNEVAIWEYNKSSQKLQAKERMNNSGQVFYSVGMKGSLVAFSTFKKKNHGLTNYKYVFDLVERDVRKIRPSDSIPHLVTESNGVTLSTNETDEILYIKKKGQITGQVKRTMYDGFHHDVYAVCKDTIIITGGAYGFLEAYNLSGKRIANFIGHEETVGAVGFSADHKYMVSGGNDQTIHFWRLSEIGIEKNVSPALSLFISAKNDWVLWNRNGYFTSSKKGARFVGYHINQGKNKEAKFYSFEQFDAKFNRPDIIMEELGLVDQGIIDLYHNAYLKRLSRMGLTETDLSDNIAAPSLEITDTILRFHESDMTLVVHAFDSTSYIKSIQILVNDVPISGANGIELTTTKNEIEIPLRIDLMSGRNKIQVSAFNGKGVESMRETIVVSNLETTTSDLYLISMGVSDYKNSAYDLEYAAKDATDIQNLFSQATHFETIHQVSLLNQEVTREKIFSLKDLLMGAKPDDIVFIFIAGHGVLNKDLEYYYATHDMDFLAPEKSGISYAELEVLFEGIRAIRKLLVMDTCHSGEVDKNDIEEVSFVEVDAENVTFRSGNSSTTYREAHGLQQTNEAVKEMFNDLRRGTGATVISSAGGAEYAMESAEWKNGLFTWCLLEGIQSRNADINKDQVIMLSEMQNYVSEKVAEISQGRQMPTSRFENISLDYRIW